MEIKEQQKIYILFGVFGICFLIVYYSFLLKPLFSGFISKNKEYFAVKLRVKAAEDLIANEESIKKQHAHLKEQADAFAIKLPAQAEISSLLEDFSRIAESSGVKIQRIKPLEIIDSSSGSADSSNLFSEFPILIESKAGYHQCGIFINNLETMDRFIEVDDVDIKSNPSEPRRQDIKLRVHTYVTRQ